MKAVLLDRMIIDPSQDFSIWRSAPVCGANGEALEGDRVEIVVVAVQVDNDDVVRAALEAALPDAPSGKRAVDVG